MPLTQICPTCHVTRVRHTLPLRTCAPHAAAAHVLPTFISY